MGEIMNQNEMSNDAFDERLTRLFAEKNVALPSDAFMQPVLARLQREHRLRWIRRILFAAVLVGWAFAVTPLVVRATLGVFSVAGQFTRLPGADVAITLGMALIAGAVYLRARHRA